MSKNTRWALAIVGAAIIIVAAVVIGTGKDSTDATPTHTHENTSPTPTQGTGAGATTTTGTTGQTGSGGGSGGGDNGQSGGASPSDSGTNDNSGGAGPQEESGGAKAQIGVVSPVLTAASPRTVTVSKGKTVTIRAKSSKAATLHIHGYDKTVPLSPNRTGRISFKATIDGEFPIEFHYSGSEAEAGTLRVNP